MSSIGLQELASVFHLVSSTVAARSGGTAGEGPGWRLLPALRQNGERRSWRRMLCQAGKGHQNRHPPKPPPAHHPSLSAPAAQQPGGRGARCGPGEQHCSGAQRRACGRVTTCWRLLPSLRSSRLERGAIGVVGHSWRRRHPPRAAPPPLPLVPCRPSSSAYAASLGSTDGLTALSRSRCVWEGSNSRCMPTRVAGRTVPDYVVGLFGSPRGKPYAGAHLFYPPQRPHFLLCTAGQADAARQGRYQR